MINFVPFPILKTNNITLRQIKAADQMAVFQGLSNEQVIKHYGVEYHSYADTRAQLNWYNELLSTQTGIWWAITQPGNNHMIGACGLYNLQTQHRKAELGYWLMPAYWSRGLMQQALQTLLNYACKQLLLHRVEAYVETENIASYKLLQRLGFQHEGTLQDTEIKKGRFISLDVLALINKSG